jgi:hypothetical protein
MMVATALAGVTFAGGPAVATVPAARSYATGCVLPVFGPGKDYHPTINPLRFSATVDNPWFPLRPGTTYLYAGTKDGAAAIDVFAVSTATKIIDGVQTRVVHDRLFLDGVLHERTSDYYAQDRCGNVWYFGEDTAELDRRGRVTTREGSFRAGVAGAQPGVYMQAQPQLGRRFRQEWLAGQAEDAFSAVGLDATVAVPYGTFRHALRTRETTALEPAVVDNKFYVRGIGQVKEVAVKGGTEQLSLVDVLR